MTDDPDSARRRRHRNERIAAASVVLLLAGIAGGIVWWKQRVTDELRDSTYIPQNVTLTPEMELLRDYVRIDTSTPAGAANGARWLAAQLQKRGIAAEIIESAPQRLNVYVRVRGRTPGKALLLFNHIDVVPATAQWSHPPFAGMISGDQLYGRGTLDMKGTAICQLLAFADIARGPAPAHDLVFLATADEETGSRYGMQWLLANRPDIFAGVKYGLTEGGLTELMREKMTYFGIEIGGKQLVEFTVTGKDQESLRQARTALEPYMFPREAERVIPEVARFLKTIAPTRMAFRPYLEDIHQTIRDGEFWRLPSSYRDYAQNTLWADAPLRKDGRWSMTVRQINLPDELPDQRIAWLERLVAPYGVELGEVLIKEGPVPLSPVDTPLFRILADEGARRYQVTTGEQIQYRSTSDSRFLRTRGIVSYGVAPFPIDFYQSVGIHGVNERIRLQWFTQGIEYMRSVVGQWARGAE
ncbi:MAG TPA: M20/M25/M40 family metallo-hydrolase [Thermoanaerobaculia bacterium]|nr:M20/M25/M40 family metallo-hydrolase [Thermoanaerobaculia bacterium]